MEDKKTNIERVTYMDGMILVADNVNQLPVDERAFRPDMFIVLICNQGRLQTDINGRQYLIEAGDMLLCNSFHTLTDALHSIDFSCSIYCFPGTSSAEAVHVNEKVLRDFFFANDNPVIHLTEEQRGLFRTYKILIGKKLEDGASRYSEQSMSGLHKAILYDILAVIDKRKHETAEATNTHDEEMYPSVKSDKVKRFLMLLAEDDSRHHTVEYFASQLYVTPKYLSVICKHETGKTPSAWIRERLIEKIRYYLLNTSLSAKEIAHRVDMPNSSFFGKFVKQHFGCTPMEYRNKQMNSEP
ncbi:MAG: helix-turn-helix transcriptional regulator [Prevotella sp.]|nr:helix-turn-helix transcriptional regulator [Prevotella sp.]